LFQVLNGRLVNFYDIFVNLSTKKNEILLAGHSRQPTTRHEKGRGEIFNPPPLVSPHRSVPF
jgi:hypothetical protein